VLGGSEEEPLVWPQSRNVDPYTIFGLDKKQRFSQKDVKRRYYDLVKMYHPDTAAARMDHEMTDRFKKVVAAYDILSDPSKRAAYDHFGAGWDGHPSIPGRNPNARSPSGASSGGTWDGFYANNGRQPDPIYTSNVNFFGIIMVIGILGGIAQIVRLGGAVQGIQDAADRRHFASSRDLARARRQARGLTSEEKIERFLQNRENQFLQPEVLRIRDSDVCESSQITKKAA